MVIHPLFYKDSGGLKGGKIVGKHGKSVFGDE
jgi:hypothetical protein